MLILFRSARSGRPTSRDVSLVRAPRRSGPKVSKPRVAVIFAGVLAIVGCAPGVSGPALGEQPRSSESSVEPKLAANDVVVVEKSQPSLSSQVRSQQSQISKLRDELNASRSRSDAAEAQAREAQTQIRNLQSELTKLNARVDTTAAQSEQAVQLSKELLSNLVAAREEQRSQIERNLRTYDAMDQRLKSIETLVAETRRQRESDAAVARENYSATDQRLQKANQELGQLREQLAAVSRENKELRTAIDSGAMMGMLRDMETMRRDTSQLRGTVEEVQRQQEEARKRMQNYYLDLDARIQALQDKQAAARKKSGAADSQSSGDLSGTPAKELEQASPSSVGVPGSSTENGTLPPLEIAPYGSESNASGQHESTAPSGAVEKKQPPPVAGQGQFTTDWRTDTSSPSAAPAKPTQ